MTNHGPEAQFQNHLVLYLQNQHGYTLLESEDISDKEFYIAEDLLFAFIKATQAETLARLQVNYGSDSFDEIIKALKAALVYQPLWLIIRNGLKVRGENFQLFYPQPPSSDSIANQHWLQNRIQIKPELVIKDAERPDLVLFLNGLPIIVIELKHEKIKRYMMPLSNLMTDIMTIKFSACRFYMWQWIPLILKWPLIRAWKVIFVGITQAWKTPRKPRASIRLSFFIGMCWLRTIY